MRIAMTKKLDNTFIQIVHPVCCGLDVHKKKISACLITIDEQGQEHYEIKEFGTFTNDLLTMKKWLTDNGCPIMATGVGGASGPAVTALPFAACLECVPGRSNYPLGYSLWAVASKRILNEKDLQALAVSVLP